MLSIVAGESCTKDIAVLFSEAVPEEALFNPKQAIYLLETSAVIGSAVSKAPLFGAVIAEPGGMDEL